MGMPWCLIAKVEYGHARVIKCREDRADSMRAMYGWTVLIRESEMPCETFEPEQSNPVRHPEHERPRDHGEQ